MTMLLMLGARLVSVQKLLGHSDPKITERRYGHLLPDFMKSEVDRLRFGIDRLAPEIPEERPSTPASRPYAQGERVREFLQRFAAVSVPLGTSLVQSGARTTLGPCGGSRCGSSRRSCG